MGKMLRVTASSIVSRCSNAVAREAGDGVTVILDLDDGVYYRINAVGTAVWKLLDSQPLTIEKITREIVTEHDAETEICRRDVMAFVEAMATAGLFEVGEGEPR